MGILPKRFVNILGLKNDRPSNHWLYHHLFVRGADHSPHSSNDVCRHVGLCLLSVRLILCGNHRRHTDASLASVTLYHHDRNRMNPVIHDISLATGGSHYPRVGGQLLEQSILMAVRQCVTIAIQNGDNLTAQAIVQHFGIE